LTIVLTDKVLFRTVFGLHSATPDIVTPKKNWPYAFSRLRLIVCLSVTKIRPLKKLRTDFSHVSDDDSHGPDNNRLHFVDDRGSDFKIF